MPANLKIQLKPSMSEIRNYLVANPIVALGKIEDSIVERLRRHKQRITFCENKKAKYDDNVPFDFPFFNERQTKTTQSIKKLFLLIELPTIK